MATPNVTHRFQPNTLAKGGEVNQNFTDIINFIVNNVIQRDGSLSFSAIPSGPDQDPSSDNQFVRKKYVDTHRPDRVDRLQETYIDLGDRSGTVTLDWSLGSVWRVNPTGNITIAWLNRPEAGLAQGGTLVVANSNFTITWPSLTKFVNGVKPVLSGETWLSMVCLSKDVHVAAVWSGVQVAP